MKSPSLGHPSPAHAAPDIGIMMVKGGALLNDENLATLVRSCSSAVASR